MYCRKTEKAVEFKTKLGFNPINLIMSKEEAVTTIIMKSFVGVKMIEQYPVLSKKIDLYIPDHKLATEIDEKRHIDSKNKIKQKKDLDVKLLELMLIVKNLIYILKFVKYKSH